MLDRLPLRLVDLIVLLLVLGLILAVVVPYVLQSRELGRRNLCEARLTQLALSTQAYYETHLELPGYLMPLEPGTITWAGALLPRLEPAPPRAGGAPVLPTVRHVPALICPSDDTAGAHPASLSYAANCGRPDYLPGHEGQILYDDPANGLFQHRFGLNRSPERRDAGSEGDKRAPGAGDMPIKTGARPPPQPAATPEKGPAPPPAEPQSLDAQIEDGASYTILFSENLQCGSWAGAEFGRAEGRTVIAEFFEPPGAEQLTGIVWWPEQMNPATARPERRINALGNIAPIAPNMNFARPSSNHPGGVNAAMADGSTRFLSQAIDYYVYSQLMTPDDAASDLPPPPLAP